MDTTRRKFLQSTTLVAAGIAVAQRPLPYTANESRSNTARSDTGNSLKLGVASYSLRELARPYAIAAVKALGTPYVNLKSFHLPYETSPEERAAARREFEEAGLLIVGGGTIYLQKEDEDDIRFYFDYARDCRMPLMVIAPTPATLPIVERFVRKYDIKVAIHNHGPEDEYFPAPADALKLIADMDDRVGVCLDVGHTARTGADITEAAAEAGSRLLDIHMKDLRDLSDRDSQCVVGEGKLPIPAFLRQLQEMNYAGYVNLEYEIDAKNPLPGMQQSFSYLRGVLDGLRTSTP